jgi:HK97 family phage major capsid protein
LSKLLNLNPEERMSELRKRKKEIRQEIRASQDIKELHRFGAELDEINDEIEEIEENQEKRSTPQGQFNPMETYIQSGEQRGQGQQTGELRSLGSFNMNGGSSPQNDNRPHSSVEYRNAFWNHMKSNDSAPEQRSVELLNNPEVRSMVISTNQAGGYLVPAYWESTLIEKLYQANVMRQLADIIPMQPGDRKLPIVTDNGQAAWIGEGQPYPESDIVLDNILLGGYKLARIIQVSEELMNDSVVNVDGMIQSSFVQSFAEMEEDAFINGWTVTQDRPTGVLGRAQLSKTGSLTTSILADEVYDIYYSLKRPYRAKASWLMNDQAIKEIRLLRDANGQFIFSPGFGTEPPTMLGRPIYTSESMPAMAAGARSILFGDFSYYKIADRQGRVMQRLNERYADAGNVGFRMFQRVDGNLALPEAIKAFENAAV